MNNTNGTTPSKGKDLTAAEKALGASIRDEWKRRMRGVAERTDVQLKKSIARYRMHAWFSFMCAFLFFFIWAIGVLEPRLGLAAIGLVGFGYSWIVASAQFENIRQVKPWLSTGPWGMPRSSEDLKAVLEDADRWQAQLTAAGLRRQIRRCKLTSVGSILCVLLMGAGMLWASTLLVAGAGLFVFSLMLGQYEMRKLKAVKDYLERRDRP